MRYDKLIELVKNGEQIYNEITGDWELPDPQSEEVYANITDLGTNQSNLLFQDLNIDGKVIRLKQAYKKPIDYILIDGKEFLINKRQLVKNKTVFIVTAKHWGACLNGKI